MIVVYILLGLLAIVALLLLVALVRAISIKNKRVLRDPAPVDKQKADKYAKSLSRMIQFPTICDASVDPKETEAVFEDFRKELEIMYPAVHKACEKKMIDGAMLFKWSGKAPQKDAVVLMAHHDVVPATGEWKHPPFAGTVENGVIWGRGTADNKGTLCGMMEAVEELITEGFVPPQDVYISSSNNEEVMGDGAVKVMEYFKENKIKLAVVIDEGGAVIEKPLPGLSGSYAMLGILEKGYANVRFTAKSAGGHSSTPPKNSPLVRLAKFMNEVETKPPFKYRFTPPVEQMFNTLAPYMNLPFRLLFANMWLFKPLLLKALPLISGQAAALLRTTCAFTMAEGSSAPNVMPETASVVANLRFMLHQPMEESLAAITEVAKKHGLETEVLYAHDCSPAVDITSKDYRFIMQCVETVFPEVGVAPYVMLGATDARSFAKDCPCTVRFAPTKISPDQLNRIHGIDETLDVDSLARAVEFYKYVVQNYSN